jgi:hypothetical protein
MIPTFDGQFDPRQFLMSFKAAVISGGAMKLRKDQHNNGTLR